MDNKKLYSLVKAGFVSQGTTLHKWCIANGIKRQNARAAILGEWTGFTAQYVRNILVSAAGVKDDLINSGCQIGCAIDSTIAQPKVAQWKEGCAMQDDDIKGLFL